MNRQKYWVASNTLQMRRLEKLYLRDESRFYDVVNYLPLLVTVSYVHSLDYKFCNDIIEDLSHLDKGYIMEKGWSIIQNHIHPENLKYQAQVLKKFGLSRGDGVLNYFQYVRKADQEDYYWMQTHKKFLTKEHYLSVYYDLSQMGEVASVITKYLGEIALSPVAYLKYQSLTKREKEILSLVSHGHTNAVIGDRLFISRLTVKTHRRNILQKLEVRSMAELIRFAQLIDQIE